MKTYFSRHESILLLVGLALFSLAWFAPALQQDPNYHQFADQRNWANVPYAMDVLTNLAFAIAGGIGFMVLRTHQAAYLAQCHTSNAKVNIQMAAVFFAGLLLTTLASGWYHLNPNHQGLTIDRLGMAIAFAGLISLAVAQHISARAAYACLAVLLLCAPASVVLWFYTGNVLPWAVVQFGGMLVVIALAWVAPLNDALRVRWGWVIFIYMLAKVLEFSDVAIYQFSDQIISGHSLKHIVAAAAAWPVITAIVKTSANNSINRLISRHNSDFAAPTAV